MNIKNLPNMVKALVLGALAMYLFDPVLGEGEGRSLVTR